MKSERRLLITFAFFLILGSACKNKAPVSSLTLNDDFTWIDEDQDKHLWSSARTDFKKDLQPDASQQDPNVIPMVYKQIFKIGCFQESCLVIVEGKENSDPNSSGVYTAYNYNPTRNLVTPLGLLGMDWSYYGRANFGPGQIKDILYTSKDCVECESTTSLYALKYDGTAWHVREWPEKTKEILVVQSDVQHWDEGDAMYMGVFRVFDYSKDGIDDIVSWFRWVGVGDEGDELEINPKIRPLEDMTTVHSVVEGKENIRVVTEKGELNEIHSLLCTDNPESELCHENVGKI